MNFSFYTCQCPAARCFACTKPSTWHSNCDDAAVVCMGGFRISLSFAHFDTSCPNFKIKRTLRFPYGLRAGKLSVGPSLLHQLNGNLSFHSSFHLYRPTSSPTCWLFVTPLTQSSPRYSHSGLLDSVVLRCRLRYERVSFLAMHWIPGWKNSHVFLYAYLIHVRCCVLRCIAKWRKRC